MNTAKTTSASCRRVNAIPTTTAQIKTIAKIIPVFLPVTRTHAQQIRKSLDALHMEEITNTVVHALRSPTPAEKAIVASMPADTTANR